MMTLGFSAIGDGFHLVVVDGLGVAAHVIERGAVQLAAEAQPVAVRQVAAVRKIEAENGVARLQDRRVGRGVGLRAGVRLHVDVLAAEELPARDRGPGSPRCRRTRSRRSSGVRDSPRHIYW